MDKVFIEGLEIDALIGIYDWERRIRQTLRFDLEMGFDNRKPAASDNIEDTLNYKAVSRRLVEFVSQSDYGLVETLAERCAEIVLAEFNVASVSYTHLDVYKRQGRSCARTPPRWRTATRSPRRSARR